MVWLIALSWLVFLFQQSSLLVFDVCFLFVAIFAESHEHVSFDKKPFNVGIPIDKAFHRNDGKDVIRRHLVLWEKLLALWASVQLALASGFWVGSVSDKAGIDTHEFLRPACFPERRHDELPHPWCRPSRPIERTIKSCAWCNLLPCCSFFKSHASESSFLEKSHTFFSELPFWPASVIRALIHKVELFQLLELVGERLNGNIVRTDLRCKARSVNPLHGE